ncbi:hypothetical protein ZIOFF_025402 [Zingiber officinale]|uniref:Uncharacterized protein n=1 Tax=Zingiber officinale TaxID=94328 RepID=A0A8J5H3M5_ZINOF|nr:hypothetical protein ZIOFF_025402 [Zingiber officinale]
MGNCIVLQEPVTWVDDHEDDWGFTESKLPAKLQEKEEAATRNTKKKVEGSTEIRVTISKKQLEHLLQQVDAQGMPLLQVLSSLVGGPRRLEEEQERHWRPKLRTIPECLSAHIAQLALIHFPYAKLDKEDPEEMQRLKARFLIYKILEEAGTQQRRSYSSRMRVCRMKRKIGVRLRRLRVAIAKTRHFLCYQILKHLKPVLVTN